MGSSAVVNQWEVQRAVPPPSRDAQRGRSATKKTEAVSLFPELQVFPVGPAQQLFPESSESRHRDAMGAHSRTVPCRPLVYNLGKPLAGTWSRRAGGNCRAQPKERWPCFARQDPKLLIWRHDAFGLDSEWPFSAGPSCAAGTLLRCQIYFSHTEMQCNVTITSNFVLNLLFLSRFLFVACHSITVDKDTADSLSGKIALKDLPYLAYSQLNQNF